MHIVKRINNKKYHRVNKVTNSYLIHHVMPFSFVSTYYAFLCNLFNEYFKIK
jgi:hypothetical protein